MLPGIHLVHKPVGPTSHSVVREWLARTELPLCHGGTLDPFAEGLLLLLVGQATRLMPYVHAVPKVYEAEVRWGTETDNGDPGGKVVAEGDPRAVATDAVAEAVARFVGWTEQVPPSTSAKKIGGEPAYRKVHRGEHVVLPPSRVYLHEATWLAHDLPRTSRLRLACRGGFYVRALVRDLGRAVGCPAHVGALRRTGIGPYADPGPGRTVHVAGDGLLPWLPSRPLDDREAEAVRRGQDVPADGVRIPDSPVPPGFPEPEGPIRALHGGRLVALLRPSPAGLHPVANLRGGL